MEEFFTWQERYDLGIDQMDGEHKVLVQKMNALFAASRANSHTVEQCFDQFIDCTKKHFAAEEKYMESIRYPGLATHKLNHKNLLDKVMQYHQSFTETNQISDDFFAFLKLWLSSHICGIDMKYAKHANS